MMYTTNHFKRLSFENISSEKDITLEGLFHRALPVV